MLRLIFKRHGQKKESFEKTNADLEITDFAKKKARSVAQQAIELNLVPDIIFESPMLRAKQDTDALSEVFDEQIQRVVHECLHERSWDMIEELFDDMNGHQTVLCVSHQPTIAMNSYFYTGYKHEILESQALVLVFDTQEWKNIDAENHQKPVQIIRPEL